MENKEKNLSIFKPHSHWLIPIQTMQFLTALSTHQDGIENRDKANWKPHPKEVV